MLSREMAARDCWGGELVSGGECYKLSVALPCGPGTAGGAFYEGEG